MSTKLITGAIISALFLIFISSLASATTPTLTIHSPEQNKQYFTEFITLNASTDLLSNVSYSLNGGPLTVLYNTSLKGTAPITLKQGQNDLKAIAENGTDKSEKAFSFKLEKCSIDAKNITARGDSVVFSVENTGTTEQDIRYLVKVNLAKIGEGTDKISKGSSKEFSAPYTFKLGSSYQLEANVTSSCGAQDFVGAGYSKTGPSACADPSGAHDTFRTNSTEGKTYKCNNGAWEFVVPFTSAEDKYCTAGNRCGDGVLNCGEAPETCPADYTQSFAKCDCTNKKFYSETRAISPGEFFDVCKSNCTLQCLSDFSCQEGDECRNFGCQPKAGRCGIKIVEFDYSPLIGMTETGQAFATIKNTGLIKENVTAVLSIRDYIMNSTSFILNQGSEKLQEFQYKSAFIGDQQIKLDASVDCIASDAKTGTLTVRNVTVVSSPDIPLVTEVKLLSDKIETYSNKEKSLTLDLKTTRPQIFTIKITGVPEDWLDYPKTVGITEDRKLNIFVKPEKVGEYEIQISIEGSKEKFAQAARLIVSQPKPETPLDQNIVIGMVVFLVVLFSAVIFVGTKYLRM